MGDLRDRTAQLATGVEAVVRLRMMGVHVSDETRGRRARGGVRPSRPTLHRVLAELDLLRGDITKVHWYTARRPVARVDFQRAGSVILKWLDKAELETDNESWALALLGGLPLTADLRRALPSLIGATADGRVQAFEHIGNAATWAEQNAAGPSATEGDSLVALGTCLADLHALPVEDHAVRHPDRCLRFPIPSLLRLTPTEFALGYGADFPEYMATMQSIDAQLSALRESWTTSAYIHFDLRDDNVLFDLAQPAVSLIDWETAGFGDPCYDVGTVIGQMLAHRIPTLRSGAGPRALGLALAAAETFIAAYRRRSLAGEAMTLRSLQFAGVFLLLSCLGRLEKVGSLGQVGHLCLLVGRQLVLRPEASHAAFSSKERG